MVYFMFPSTANTHSRVANDMSLFDVGKYHLAVVPTNPDGELRFHIGEPITIAWRSPLEHSRRDWIGIYRVSLTLPYGCCSLILFWFCRLVVTSRIS
jgi:hypothetical protein